MATWIAHLRIAENVLKKYEFEIKPKKIPILFGL